MGYQLLRLAAETPSLVERMIRVALEPQLRDIHTMFRLPMRARGLEAGCNFAIAHNLLALISGISVTLYEHDGGSGELFQRLMDDVYWKIDPPEGIDPSKATDVLYKEFRNVLTHDLGIAIDYDQKTKKRRVVQPDFRLVIKKYEGLSEEVLELREIALTRPEMSATLRVEGKTATLLVDGLYWGLRRLVETLTHDKARMKRAEAFLSMTRKP